MLTIMMSCIGLAFLTLCINVCRLNGLPPICITIEPTIIKENIELKPKPPPPLLLFVATGSGKSAIGSYGLPCWPSR